MRVPIEFVHTLQPSGMPSHVLELKEGMVALVMRNVRPAQGLVNGRRVRVVAVHNTSVTVTVLTGQHKGNTTTLPRILFVDSKTFPFTLKRRQVRTPYNNRVCLQYPLLPAYALTVHKAQSQTLDRVAVYLPDSVFVHGMLYVAASRVTHPTKLKVPYPFNKHLDLIAVLRGRRAPFGRHVHAQRCVPRAGVDAPQPGRHQAEVHRSARRQSPHGATSLDYVNEVQKHRSSVGTALGKHNEPRTVPVRSL